MWWWLGCRAAEPCGSGGSVEAFDPAPTVSIARGLRVTLLRPASVAVSLDGTPSGPASPPAVVHELPLLGLRSGERHRIEVRCGAEPVPFASLELEGRPMSAAWPTIEPWVDAPERRSPGRTLVDLSSDDVHWLALLDPDGAPVWAYRSAQEVLDATLDPAGTVWILSDGRVDRIDWLGRPVASWAARAFARDGDLALDVNTLHHAVTPLPDGGFVGLDLAPFEVDAYPLSVDDPEGPTAPATLSDGVVVRVAADGSVVERFSIAERLDPARIGWLSLQQDALGYDWGHVNAVSVDPRDGGYVVGVRHQDAVIKLDPAGELQWIVSPPDGWRSPWAELRLDAVGGASWPYHAHAPRISADGRLTMFDNGNHGRTTPYAGEPGEDWSRIVEYQVDEGEGTVAEVASAEPSTGPEFSPAFGDADLLPNGDHLGVWGYLFSESGVRNVDRGRGVNSVRLVEVAPDGEVVWELSLWSTADRPAGWRAHRAQRIP
ncbi:MAG: aryl-sulfate sulfotransferase [Myxococcota bacterium]